MEVIPDTIVKIQIRNALSSLPLFDCFQAIKAEVIDNSAIA